LGKTSALRFENVKFFKKPALYALKTLNFKLTLPSLGGGGVDKSYDGKKAWPSVNHSMLSAAYPILFL
jgi:hypothetical protein